MCRFFEYTAFLIHTHTPAFPAGVAPSALTSSNTATKENRAFYYDARGRVVQQARTNAQGGTATETLSYTYSGPKRTNTGWQYDNHGNLTADPQAGLSVAWNAIDLPRTLTSGSAGTSRAYLADGTLAQIYDGSTTRLYLGDLVFTRTGTSGTPALESAGWEGGRLLNGSGTGNVLYYVTDHLGSTRVVKDGSGTIRQRFDYYPYGTVSRVYTSSSTTDSSEKRYRFGGKEIAGSALTELGGTGAAPAAPYLDFGARLYSPRAATWLSVDPIAEKYYGISPFVYCAASPLNLVDPTGESTFVFYDNKTGKYIVFGGELNNDYNIYEYFPDENGEYTISGGSIGRTLTPTSFFHSEYNVWEGIIDPSDQSGIDFLNRMINDNGMPKYGLVNYMDHARTGHEYDFKVGGEMYRGMPIGYGIYASARDIGNYVAGYYAAANGIPWRAARFAFDLYQGTEEGISTQNAQYLGWTEGNMLSGLRKGLNVFSSYVGGMYFDSKALIVNSIIWRIKTLREK